MVALSIQFSGIETLFLVCAIIGGVLFVVRLALQFIGGDSGGHHDIGGISDVSDVGDIDIHGADVHGDFAGDADLDVHDTYLSFKILSFQGLTAFFMMFGLVGLAMMRSTDQGPTAALIAASLAGFGTVWVIGAIFRKAGALQASGNINLRNAIGQEGEVYLTIHSAGTGKAKVTVQERLRIYDAVSTGSDEICTGQRVRVVDVTPQEVLVVEKIQTEPKEE
jgi:membrane protein implicated in regulation of membrane protease activity